MVKKNYHQLVLLDLDVYPVSVVQFDWFVFNTFYDGTFILENDKTKIWNLLIRIQRFVHSLAAYASFHDLQTKYKLYA